MIILIKDQLRSYLNLYPNVPDPKGTLEELEKARACDDLPARYMAIMRRLFLRPPDPYFDLVCPELKLGTLEPNESRKEQISRFFSPEVMNFIHWDCAKDILDWIEFHRQFRSERTLEEFHSSVVRFERYLEKKDCFNPSEMLLEELMWSLEVLPEFSFPYNALSRRLLTREDILGFPPCYEDLKIPLLKIQDQQPVAILSSTGLGHFCHAAQSFIAFETPALCDESLFGEALHTPNLADFPENSQFSLIEMNSMFGLPPRNSLGRYGTLHRNEGEDYSTPFGMLGMHLYFSNSVIEPDPCDLNKVLKLFEDENLLHLGFAPLNSLPLFHVMKNS